MATFDEAKTCPKCKNPMQVESKEALPHIGSNCYLYTVICYTEGCRWFGTGRAIQVNNGIVYERPRGERGMDKTFPTMTPDQLARGQRDVEDAVQRDLRSEGRP
jgi:hypothetical protein